MKIRKILAGTAALALAAAMSMTAFAEAAESITVRPVGVTPDGFNINPNPDSPETEVKFSTDPSYIVTIPASVELSGTKGSVYSGTGTVTATDVFLEKGQVIKVKLTSASGFKLSDANGAELDYSAYPGTSTTPVDKTQGGFVAEFKNDKETPVQTADITFKTDSAPEYAGSFSDTVVFNISIAAE